MLIFHFPDNMSPEAIPVLKFFLWKEIWLTIAVEQWFYPVKICLIKC